MRCPNCGMKLRFTDMTWKEQLFWFLLICIGLNQSAQFYDWVKEAIWYWKYFR